MMLQWVWEKVLVNITLSSVLNGGSTMESKLIYSNDGEQSLDGFGGWLDVREGS